LVALRSIWVLGQCIRGCRVFVRFRALETGLEFLK
jgi:hypothetical protein